MTWQATADSRPIRVLSTVDAGPRLDVPDRVQAGNRAATASATRSAPGSSQPQTNDDGMDKPSGMIAGGLRMRGREREVGAAQGARAMAGAGAAPGTGV